MLAPTILVAGLANGQIFAWDIEKNLKHCQPLHNAGVTAFKTFNQFLLSGDEQGSIKVSNNADLSLLMQGQVQQGIKQHDATITSLAVLEHQTMGAPVVVAGNRGGYITLVQ